MASNFIKKSSLYIKGIMHLEEGHIMIEVDGMDTPINLAEFVQNFEDEEVAINISHNNKLT